MRKIEQRKWKKIKTIFEVETGIGKRSKQKSKKTNELFRETKRWFDGSELRRDKVS
jgi:hypothetical protein